MFTTKLCSDHVKNSQEVDDKHKLSGNSVVKYKYSSLLHNNILYIHIFNCTENGCNWFFN